MPSATTAVPNVVDEGLSGVMLDARRLKAIIFDVDGTLYPQVPLRRAMLFRLLRAAVLDPSGGVTAFRALRAYRHAQEVLRDASIDGSIAAAQLRLASQHSGLGEQAVAAVVSRWMEKEPLKLLEQLVEPALRPLLEAARARGIRLGVFSDYPASAKLEAMRLIEFFDEIVCAQDEAVNRFKPHPSGLLEALRRLGASPDEALYVGDRYDVDGPAARAAGVQCIIVRAKGVTRRSESWPTVSDYGELHAMLFPGAS